MITNLELKHLLFEIIGLEGLRRNPESLQSRGVSFNDSTELPFEDFSVLCRLAAENELIESPEDED